MNRTGRIEPQHYGPRLLPERQQLVNRITELRDLHRRSRVQIAFQVSEEIGRNVSTEEVRAVLGSYSAGEARPIRAPIFDGWWFGDDNVAVDRYTDREVYA